MSCSIRHFFIIILIALSQTVFSQCPAPIHISIDTVITTESRCNTSGTATVSAVDGAAPFTYSIISGPVLASPQAGNLFQALSPGSYTVLVTDNCNQSTTKNFTIIGSYQEPEVNIILESPECPGGANGKVTVEVTKGRLPISYSLISPSPILAGPQVSNVFTGLVAGSYTCQITDSCNNFQTRTFTIIDAQTQNIYLSNQIFKWQACDSFALGYTVANFNFTELRFPITATFTVGTNVPVTHILNKGIDNILRLDTFFFRYAHVTNAYDPFSIKITDVCGNTFTHNDQLHSYLDMYESPYNISGCSRQIAYKLDDLKDNSNPQSSLVPHCATITYTLISPAGVTLLTQTNNSFFTGYPAGIGYKVIREDCCRKDTLVFDWKETPQLSILYDLSPQYTCKENTTGLRLFANINTFIAPLTVVLVSGPPSITFSDGSVKNYVYPDTLATKDPTGGLIIDYLTTGSYSFVITDTCGQVFPLNVTVQPSDLRHSSISTKIERGCLDNNKIVLQTTSNTGAFFGNDPTPAYVDITELPGYIKLINQDAYTDSAVNLAPGIYHLNYHYDNPWRRASLPILIAKGMEDIICDSIIYTTVVPEYTQPLFTTPLAIAVCGETGNVALLPDSSRGVFPYTYQIIEGPITTSEQSSPIFNNLTKGVYTFRVSDFCGNSYSSSIAIDTLIFPDIVTIGSTCKGDSAIFQAPVNPYYSYVWLKPNNTISQKDSIALFPVTDSDTGVYKLIVYSAINGCVDTKTKYLRFDFCSPVPIHLVSFSGIINDVGVLISWNTLSEINVSHYYIESSDDGIHFYQLQKISAKNKNNNFYNYIDKELLSGKRYYRLVQYSADGKILHSDIIHVTRSTNDLITINNNPVKDHLGIQWETRKNTTGAVTITDMSGRTITVKKLLLTKGNNYIAMPLQSISKGIYVATFKSEENIKSFKFIKE
ncbi:MAG: T9SS type A sorting domain-containing protein [Bacteroidota bacterium]